ncbi:hypothetical protein DL768_008419 [Monosporascus sp. mg162]|nr:hypothetical protein DL768_008419 [Monosporascus sp. mg162]
MRFSITAVFALVAGVLAAPPQPAGVSGGLTVRSDGDFCGQKDTVVSCCNKVENKKTAAGGLLSGLIQDLGLDLFSQCSQLDLTGIIGVSVDELLKDQCSQSIACCQPDDLKQSGLVNIGCIPIAL